MDDKKRYKTEMYNSHNILWINIRTLIRNEESRIQTSEMRYLLPVTQVEGERNV
jgi:hypothetical protein